jgi:general secretion pathway protein D
MTRLQRAVIILLVTLLALPAVADQAKNFYNQGQHAEARQDYVAAYNAYSKAYDLKPGNLTYRAAYTRMRFQAAAAYIHQGQLLRDAGKLDEALVLFEKAAVTDPSSFIAQQEVKKTKEMIEQQRGGAAKPGQQASGIQKMLQEAEGPVELSPISNTPITLKLTEDSKVIYQTIGKLAGLNVLFDPDYTSRRISIELNGVTLNEALDIVALQSKTFWRPVTRNTIFVASDTVAKRKELEQSVIKTFYLSNLSQPTELQDMVNAMRTILEVSRIQQLPSQSAIVIRGTPDQIALAEKLIGDIDKAKPEVIVDVVVMQVSRDRVRDLGIQPPGQVTVQLQSALSSAATSTTTTVTGTTSGTTPTATTGTTAPLTLNELANLHATNFVVTIPGATANFLFSDNNTKIIQSPEIRASDGQKASLKIGDRVPVATGSFQPGIGGVGINPLVNTQFQYIDVGVNVDVTPFVHANREITLKVMLDVSSVISNVNIGGISQPVIGQRKVEHEIRLKEGEVNLLGGILEDQDIKNLSGIPGLASIPLFHYLFSEQRNERHQNEIVFALVPHIVRAKDITDLNERALDVGTGTSLELRRRPPQAGGGGESAAPRPQAAVAPQTAMPAQGLPVPSQQQMPAPQPAAPGSVALSFDPTTVTPSVGSTFAVNVVLTGGQSIYSVPLQVTYDPKLLQLVNVSNGPFLSHDGQPVALVHRDDPTSGTVQLNATRPPGSGGISGDGVVFTLTFQAKAAGTSALAITRAGARTADMQNVPGTATQAMVTVH